MWQESYDMDEIVILLNQCVQNQNKKNFHKI